MHYKSLANLASDLSSNLYKVPDDVDLIVGVPRSGLMAAAMLALLLNRKYCDVSAFLENRPLTTGSTRRAHGSELTHPHMARKALVLDDSIASGRSMQQVRGTIEALGLRTQVLYAAVYATPASRQAIDIHFDVVEQPRLFEWNLFHRWELERCCVDIDGVLCKDPSHEENDDGERYRAFLLDATTLARPTHRIGHLVTSRLEKYRPETERWLAAAGIQYSRLHMLDLPSAEERRRQGSHGRFKAQVYASLDDAFLFIESETRQAEEIARRSGKPVLDFGHQRLVQPGWSISSAVNQSASLQRRIARRMKAMLT
jgi:uncharacterized HAD superfamily protein/adenine/guanine phosphoribosyltransferase-like PRPP-binding protein